MGRDRETFEQLLVELLGAIEQRECSDPDSRDWFVDARIRRLEREILEVSRFMPHLVPRREPVDALRLAREADDAGLVSPSLSRPPAAARRPAVVVRS